MKVIYLDNSATTKPYKEVLDTFQKISSEYYGNPSSLHGLGSKAQMLLTQGRKQMAELLKVKPQEIYFTSGGTESNNLAIKGTAFQFRNRGKHIIASAVEHPSVLEAVSFLEQIGFRVSILPVDKEGRVSVKDVEKEICDDTILVSVMHVNNEVGTIQPIEEIGKLLSKYPKVLFHVDHVQGAGKIPLNLKENNIDLCSISGHKFHGLKGTGLLYIREGVHILPILSGGGQEGNMRSGTENVAGIVAMSKAFRLTTERQKEGVQRLYEMKEKFIRELKEIEEVVVHTPEQNSAPHILNFSVKGFKGEVFVHALEKEGIYVSTTSACSSKKKGVSSTLSAMGVDPALAKGAIRISLSYENTMDEVTRTIEVIKEQIKKLKEVMK